MPRDLPIITVNVRYFYLYKGATPAEEGVKEATEQFEDAASFWLREAGIELKLLGGRVESLFDPAEPTTHSIGEPLDFERPLNELHEDGLDCVTIASFHWTSRVREGGASRSTRAFTYFYTPASGKSRYGISMQRFANPFWSTLAHELGHCFGLVHTGVSDTARALAPFPNDLDDFTLAELESNMMVDDPNFDPGEGWLSDSQVHRARLTITSRVCPFSLFFLANEPENRPNSVLMTEICAPFIVTVF
jgi:hypothetical protein